MWLTKCCTVRHKGGTVHLQFPNLLPPSLYGYVACVHLMDLYGLLGSSSLIPITKANRHETVKMLNCPHCVVMNPGRIVIYWWPATEQNSCWHQLVNFHWHLNYSPSDPGKALSEAMIFSLWMEQSAAINRPNSSAGRLDYLDWLGLLRFIWASTLQPAAGHNHSAGAAGSFGCQSGGLLGRRTWWYTHTKMQKLWSWESCWNAVWSTLVSPGGWSFWFDLWHKGGHTRSHSELMGAISGMFNNMAVLDFPASTIFSFKWTISCSPPQTVQLSWED